MFGFECSKQCRFCLREFCNERTDDFFVTHEDVINSFNNTKEELFDALNSDEFKDIREINNSHKGESDVIYNDKELSMIEKFYDKMPFKHTIPMMYLMMAYMNENATIE